MTLRTLLKLTLLYSVFNTSCSNEAIDSQVNIINGKEGLESQVSPASLFIIHLTGNKGACSATRIGPKTIILAAHCVVYENTRKLTVGKEIYYGRTDDNNRTYQATIKKIHLKDWQGSKFERATNGNGLDMAVVVLERPLRNNIKIAKIDPKKVRENDPVLITGYGCRKMTGPDYADKHFQYSLSQAASINKLFHLFSVTPAMLLPGKRQYIRENYWITGGLSGGGNSSLCPGDSGGGVFRANDNLKIIGINSDYTFNLFKGRTSAANLFVRLDTHRNYINSVIE